jgi:hypothetical protein
LALPTSTTSSIGGPATGSVVDGNGADTVVGVVGTVVVGA